MTEFAPQPVSYKRNAAASRARILEAAQEAFSTTGYSHTGIRDIAKMAGVSSTLLVRYFGSKAQLFEEALVASMRARGMVRWGREDFAEKLADALIDPAGDIRGPMIVALGSGDPEAAAIAARVTVKHGIKVMADWLDGEDAEGRTLAMGMMAAGYVIYARQLPLPSTDLSNVRQWFIVTMKKLVEGKGWKD